MLSAIIAVGLLAADASAYYHPTIGRFLTRDPGAGSAKHVGTDGPAATGRFIPMDQYADGMDVAPKVVSAMPQAPMQQVASPPMPSMLPDPEAPPLLFDPTGQHPDGRNLYQYVRGNPVRWQDPNGLNIYLKTGNNTWNPLNNAIHQNVCVDTCEDGKKTLACFSFGANMRHWRFATGVPNWLGWNLPWYYWHKPGLALVGSIYYAEDTGTVVATKKTTAIQDRRWLTWMWTKRFQTQDVYTVHPLNCGSASTWRNKIE